MEKTQTIEDVFLSLTETKRKIIRKYCSLHLSHDLPPESLTKEFISIWEKVDDDPQMVMFLELADFLYSDVCEDELDENKRSYLSEYLEREVGLKPELAMPELSEHMPHELILLKCQNGDFIMIDKKALPQESHLSEHQDWLCSNCGGDFSKHTIVRFPMRTTKQ